MMIMRGPVCTLRRCHYVRVIGWIALVGRDIRKRGIHNKKCKPNEWVYVVVCDQH